MARKSAAAQKDNLLEEFQALVSNTEKLLQDSADLAGEKGDSLRADINKSLARARDTLKQAQDSIREQGKVAVEATEDYVSSHPWQTIGLSAAVGVVLGMILCRR